jgi:hypothetical protein
MYACGLPLSAIKRVDMPEPCHKALNLGQLQGLKFSARHASQARKRGRVPKK